MDSWEGNLGPVGINNVRLSPEVRQALLEKWTQGGKTRKIPKRYNIMKYHHRNWVRLIWSREE